MRPRRPRRSLLVVLALAGACLLAVPAQAGEAQDAFDKGTAAFQDGKHEEALDHYKAAWKLTKTYDIAYAMALTEVHLGKLRDATEHFAYALAHFPVTGDAELRKSTEEAFADAKKSVVTVRIKVNAKESKEPTVTIDGTPIAPEALGEPIYLPVGAHVIEATAPAHSSVKRTLDGTAGSDEEVTLNLNPDEAPPRSKTPAFVLGGVGVVSVILGAVLVGMAEGKKSEAIKLHNDIGSADECAKQPANCKALRDASSGTDALGNAGVAAFVFGGVAGAAAGAYLLLPSRKSATPARPSKPGKPASGRVVLTPIAGASTGGLLLSGSF